MRDWLQEHEALLLAMIGLSALTLAAAVILLPALLARMPADYFVRKTPPPESWRGRHPLLRVVLRLGKNVLGVILVAVGIPLVPLPGQGLLTIFAGLLLLDFPGKRVVELRIVRTRGVLRAVNWLRGRAHRPPLVVDGEEPGEGARDPSRPPS